MGSGVIYYEYEKQEKFEDYDLKGDAELGTFKIRRYRFDDESFVHPLHSARNGKSSTRGSHPFGCSSPTPHYSPRGLSSTQRVTSPSSFKASSSLRRRVASKTMRSPKSWKLIPPSEGGMCEGDEEEKEIGGMKPFVEKKEASKEEEDEEDPEEEEDPKFIEELECRPKYSSIHSSRALVQRSSNGSPDQQSDSHNAPSYDLCGVWASPSSVPSL
ncbi:hypothetical protein PIB30_069832 [Stylosanthes scabra]|uniref:Uncharacterized protein n=1 Tax=Stylosanthes scabra TaxID=79078 RepID=A0ABU6YNP8_9FABA|nr:hypothetical protein [Stylosanthes scabra]